MGFSFLERLRKIDVRPKFRLGVAISAIILAIWVAYLIRWTAPVSRGDFLWELWTNSSAIQAGRIREIIAFIFRINAGHIIAYARVFGLLNWWLFDLSGTVIKIASITTFVLCWVALLFATSRATARGLDNGIVLVIGTILLCNPVPSLVVGWPESTVAYFTNFIAVCFGLPIICRLISDSRRPSFGHWMLIAGVCFAIIVSNGAGWGIIPTLIVAWLVGRGYLDAIFASRRLLPLAISMTIGLIAISAGALFAVTRFAEANQSTFYLDDVYLSLSQAPDNLFAVARHFFAVLAALFIPPWPMDEEMWFGVPLLLLWVWVVLRLAQNGRTRELCFWICFSTYGLIAAALNTLGRWQLTVARHHEAMPAHYGTFALPFLIGLAALVIAVAPRWPLRWLNLGGVKLPFPANSIQFAGAVVGLIVLGVFVPAVMQGSRAVESYRDWHLGARFGAQNYQAIQMARLSGDQAFYRLFTQRVIPDLKRMGKYHALSANFIDDPQAFISKERIVLTEAKPAGLPAADCAATGELTHIGPDERANWNLGSEPKLNLVWAYGFALGPHCKPVDFLFITDAQQNVLCVSRPGRPMMRDLPTATEVALRKYQNAVFNFSCPLHDDYQGGKPYSVYAWSQADRALTKFDSSGKDAD